MRERQPLAETSYYQIGGFRPNVTLQGCSATFSLKLMPLFKQVVLVPEYTNMT
jgi:hypothetical protein